VTPSEPAAGYGMVKVKPTPPGSRPRRLSEFDAAEMVKRRQRKK
jgi:hypothetical protein